MDFGIWGRHLHLAAGALPQVAPAPTRHRGMLHAAAARSRLRLVARAQLGSALPADSTSMPPVVLATPLFETFVMEVHGLAVIFTSHPGSKMVLRLRSVQRALTFTVPPRD